MIRSLHRQFLIPLSLAMLLTGLIIAGLAYAIAARSAKFATELRLQSVAEIAGKAAFPLSSTVLEQMRSLSLFEIAIFEESGQRVMATEGLRKLQHVDLQSIISRSSPAANKQTLDTLFIVHRFRIDETRYDVALRRMQTVQPNESVRWLAVFSPHAAQQQLRQQAVILPIVTGAVATLVIGFVATWLVSQMRKKIDLLRAHVGRLAKGSLEIMPLPEVHDEISDLTDDINSMTRQLNELQNVVSINQRATLINQIASGMAHQLRNTLTGARLAIQVFQRTHHQETAEDLIVAIDQLKLAEQSIQSLLQVRTGIDEQPSDSMKVVDIIDSIRSLVKNKAEHKAIDLSVNTSESLSSRRVPDGQRVMGALLNLILNAIEAAPDHGQVRCESKLINTTLDSNSSLSKRTSAEFCQFLVCDNGPGPLKSIAETMLDPFVTSKPEGIGLGLPMAKRTSQRLGGDLGWKRTEGRTEFTMSIPLVLD